MKVSTQSKSYRTGMVDDRGEIQECTGEGAVGSRTAGKQSRGAEAGSGRRKGRLT